MGLLLPALLDCVPPKQRVDNRVDGLFKVLNKDSVSCHYSLFDHIHVSGTTIIDRKGRFNLAHLQYVSM